MKDMNAEFVSEKFGLNLNQIKVKKDVYTKVVWSDILNMILVKHGGRHFALLNNNVPNADKRIARLKLYRHLIRALKLGSKWYDKNLLIWNPDDLFACEHHENSTDIGKLLGYFRPLPKGWEHRQSEDFQFRHSLSFDEKTTGLQLFGQVLPLTLSKTEHAELIRYISKTLTRLNDVLESYGMKAEKLRRRMSSSAR